MKSANDRARAASLLPTAKTTHLSTDATGKLVDDKGASQLDDELEQQVEHLQSIALIEEIEKAGKAFRRPTWHAAQLFPPFQSLRYLLS